MFFTISQRKTKARLSLPYLEIRVSEKKMKKIPKFCVFALRFDSFLCLKRLNALSTQRKRGSFALRLRCLCFICVVFAFLIKITILQRA